MTPRRSGELPAEPAPEPVRAQAIVVESIDDASGPLLLTDRMRRREKRRREKGTMIGIGHLGPIPRSIEPTPSPYALPPHAPPEPQATVPEAFAEDAVQTVRATSLRFEEHDPLDDGWGAPGTTIPPGFLGAVPMALDDRPSEPVSVPVAIPAAAPGAAAITLPGAAPVPVPVPPPAAAASLSQHARPGGTGKLPANLPAIPPPRLTPPGARPAATLTPLNRNRTVAGVPDPTRLAGLLEEASQRLVELLHGLDGASHRDHVIAMLVDFVAESHHRVAFLALRADELTPFMQIPEPAGPAARLDLRSAATFQDVIGTRLPYRGPISDPASRELVQTLFGSATDEMLLVPVAVRDRVVGVIYADGRYRHSFDEHVTVAGRAAGLALERILKTRRQ
ncbi:MAG TPA: hypothetical protein VHE35_17655 [Kofleriaceae bacterium]|nr:hypothetical protein [Kofleriaceae bacterium]